MTCFIGSVFSVGIEIWLAGTNPRPTLTADEQCYAEQVHPQLIACADERACREDVATAYVSVINSRRRLRNAYQSEVVYDRLRGPCEQLASRVKDQAECFSAKASLSKEDGFAVAGLSKAGITRRGASMLRTGMSMDEVEFILGSPGDQAAYSGGGGYSHAIYRWQQGRRLMVVSFSDDRVTGYSQSGL